MVVIEAKHETSEQMRSKCLKDEINRIFFFGGGKNGLGRGIESTEGRLREGG